MIIGPAVGAELKTLEAIQWRASLNNPGDREALLAHPDAIELPIMQIEAGGVFVVDHSGVVTGFVAIVARADGDSSLDALFVEPDAWRQHQPHLIDYCCYEGIASGAAAIHVIGNPHAEGFYDACGFNLLGTQAMRFRIGLRFMRKLR